MGRRSIKCLLLVCLIITSINVRAGEQASPTVSTGQKVLSLPGPLREGPGTKYREVYFSPTPFRYEIKAFQNTGITEGAFDWFEIQVYDEKLYIWGGNLCSKGRFIKGTRGRCKVIMDRERAARLKAQQAYRQKHFVKLTDLSHYQCVFGHHSYRLQMDEKTGDILVLSDGTSPSSLKRTTVSYQYQNKKYLVYVTEKVELLLLQKNQRTECIKRA